ncbi:MAG TPA: DUF3052 family protein [Candidatus Glassbacteria bacterium]|nr:DUF3052 family protein [Candidatus Glassbacteria bacterium]
MSVSMPVSLIKKLGLRADSSWLLLGAPPEFLPALGPLPEGVRLAGESEKNLDLVLLFARTDRELCGEFHRLTAKLAVNGALWVAWPKKASRVATDLSFERVQQTGLAAGLVDNKVCAIDQVWSGLRFVIRRKNRAILTSHP